MTKTLDLGSGPDPKNEYNADEVFGLDIIDYGKQNIFVSDIILEKFPFEDNTFDYVTGYDFLEHIPRIIYVNGERKQPFIDVMSEVWRVLKPGGLTYFVTPAYPHPEAFQDPQHVNIITEATVNYFSLPSPSARMYGFVGQFEIVSQHWRKNPKYHLVWQLKKV